MKLLLFYPTHYSIGSKPIGLSVLKAHLQKHGHEVKIFDFARYTIIGKEDCVSLSTKIGTFKPVKESEKYLMEQEKITKSELMKKIFDTINDFHPDLLGISFLTPNLALVKEYFPVIKEKTHIPVIAGGMHPTVAPEKTIKLDFIDMICLGYGEKPLLELLNSKLSNHSIPNIWFKENGEVIKNPVSHNTVDFENYEFPNWDDYSDIQFYKPFQGKVMRYGDVEFGRGCPHACTFCTISYLREKLGMTKCFKKSNEKMIEELRYLKKKYNIEIFRFWDELFLLVTDDKLSEFGQLYKKFIDLPFIIETTAESITENKLKILKAMGCVSISIGIETGNTQLRNMVLNKKTSNATYIERIQMINKSGINTTSYNMLGLPGETEEMILDTIDLNRKCQTRTPVWGVFYPLPGTYLREYCIEKGFLDPDFDDTIEESLLFRESVLRQDHILAPDKLKHYLEYFSVYCKVPVEMYPDVLRSSVDDEIGNRLKDKIRELIQL